ncbi:hypothetical protein HL658_03540 [Azospirillum sp. RWY-5-1]|uniref:Uncharacterized protein n=1 Tax=Azospirillum oleiclasticum TaxID=2735135 RepID=A0ABX2T666_9PROT|nr:hypothetical protein [Azospirillum oleiclasticum]NYZ18771.1 hypothetical protein [Azospirillum oleiclasticum]
METDIREYVLGAYLKPEEGCDVVDYNVRPPGGGLEGLGELDVVGYDFRNGRAFLCEVTTHIKGLQIGTYESTVRKITEKHARQRAYAASHLQRFDEIRFQFWSPRVPKGYLTERLSRIDGLELVINGQYRECVERLRLRAKVETQDAVNPFFRVLQILEAMQKE